MSGQIFHGDSTGQKNSITPRAVQSLGEYVLISFMVAACLEYVCRMDLAARNCQTILSTFGEK